MRGVAAACWVAIALLGSARAEEPATTSTTAAPTASAAPAASAPVVQETTVRGTPPDLAGRWLAVAWIELSGRITNVTVPWDITERDGRLQLTELFVDLNFDEEIGNPEADPSVSLRRARAALEAFAPGS